MLCDLRYSMWSQILSTNYERALERVTSANTTDIAV